MAIDAQRLRTQYIYEARSPLESLLADVAEIGKMLDASQAQRRKLRWFSLYCLIAGVVSFITGVVSQTLLLLLPGIAAFVGCLVLFIYSFMYNQLCKHRNRHDLLKQLLGIVQRDAPPRTPFAVRLSMASAPQFLSEEAWPARKSGKQKFFSESWLSIEGPLLDATTLSADVTELSRKRTCKSASGKWKTKTRNRYLVTLRFAYREEIYGDARRAQLALHEPVRVPSSATVRGVRVSDKAITVKGLVRLEKEIASTAAMLSMGAYRILNLARRVAASRRGDAN